MTELLVVGVIAVLVIAAAAVWGPRLGVAAPLVLVAVGIVASLVPWVPQVDIEPEWILAGVLPPLLYSSAVSMPAMNFRREFGAIGGLSVLLVVASAVVLGLFFAWVIPGLGLAWGVALGAVVSPTDAVATSIVKQTSVSKRVVAILDGESLLNDATALVLLRTAIAAVAASFSFWGALGTFAWSVLIAVVVGLVVGWLNLAVRSRVPDAAVNTAISFAVPFAAAIPAEHLGGSGLVAAVVAGLVTGVRGARMLPPRHRVSDGQNWRTVELVLEGAVFLVMGYQIAPIISSVRDHHEGIGAAVLIAVGALLLTLLVRTAYVVPLLFGLAKSNRRGARMQPRLEGMQERLQDPGGVEEDFQRRGRGARVPSERDLQRFGVRITRMLADIRYFSKEPMGWREGTTIIWAGMRGAVTVAAAQTLGAGEQQSTHESLLVFIAFAVALFSLVLQGGTIGPLLRWISPPAQDSSAQDEADRTRLYDLLREASKSVGAGPLDPSVRADVAAVLAGSTEGRAVGQDGTDEQEGTDRQHAAVGSDAAPRPDSTVRSDAAPRSDGAVGSDRTVAAGAPGASTGTERGASAESALPRPSREVMRSLSEHRLAVLGAQRKALLDARDDGEFDADVLDSMLTNLDAEQIAMEMRGGPRD